MNWPDDFINKIICGDCLGVMKEMPDSCVDLALTDPPYFLPNIQFRPKMRQKTRIWSNFNFAQIAFEIYLKELLRVATPDFEFYLFTDELSYAVLYPLFYSNFYSSKLIVWDKQNIGLGGKWRRQFELLIYAYNGKNKGGQHSDIIRNKRARSQGHPFEKPVELIKKILTLSEPKLVLDPFLGSGTTALACKQLNRNFIGIEINPDYCKIAEERLAQGVL